MFLRGISFYNFKNFSINKVQNVSFLNSFFLFKRAFVFKPFGKKLYYVYGGAESKINNAVKSEKEILYKFGDATLGILYYKANFNNMISIFFRITGVILFLCSLVYILSPFFFLYASKIFFFDYEFIFINFSRFFFFDFLEFHEFFFFDSIFLPGSTMILFFLLLFFKYVCFVFFFSFFFHILKKVYIFFEFYKPSQTNHSGYNHYLVRGY